MLKLVTINILLSWISLNTNYDTRKFDIKILLVSKKEIQEKACGGKCPVIAFLKKNEGIYITKMNFEKNLCNQSILLHEMIHFFQDSKMLNAFREKEAYQLQNKFLEENSNKKLNLRVCRRLQNF